MVDKKPVRIYTQVPSPKSLRREVLMTAVDSLEAVKSIDNYHSVNKDKALLENKFKGIVARIKVLNNKLKNDYVPEVRSTSRLEKKIKEEKKVVSQPKPAPRLIVEQRRTLPRSKYDKEIDELKNLINSI